MKKDLPLTEIVSSCRTSSDCPANFPALFTSWTCPFTSYPEGTASPSEGRGASSVARNVCPDWAFSESRGSSSRIAIDVPDGTVTLFGAGGGAGAAAAAGTGCFSAAACSATGGGGTLAAISVESDLVCRRGVLGRSLAADLPGAG